MEQRNRLGDGRARVGHPDQCLSAGVGISIRYQQARCLGSFCLGQKTRI